MNSVKDDPISTPAGRSSRVVRLLAIFFCLSIAGASPLPEKTPAKTDRKPVASITRSTIPFVAVGTSPIEPQRPETIELLHDAIASAPVAHIVWLEVTAYCPCAKCCGPNAQGLTASGKSVSYNGGAFVAADTDLFPFGTRVSIPGYCGSQPVEVIDRGSAVKGNHIDVFFPTHEQALEWGRRRLPVTVSQ